jgi:RNA polymerase sigma-70 factor (ECF subfamily)
MVVQQHRANTARSPSVAALPTDRLSDVFDEHYSDVYRYLRSRVGEAAAEDLAQDAFLVVAANARLLRGCQQGAARPVLFGVATKLVRQHWRSEARRTQVTARVAHQHTGAGAGASDAEDADGRVDASALGPRLATALAALSDRERDVLLLFALAELEPREIAESLGLATVTVRVRLHRGRKRLRAELAGAESPALITQSMSLPR